MVIWTRETTNGISKGHWEKRRICDARSTKKNGLCGFLTQFYRKNRGKGEQYIVFTEKEDEYLFGLAVQVTGVKFGEDSPDKVSREETIRCFLKASLSGLTSVCVTSITRRIEPGKNGETPFPKRKVLAPIAIRVF